MRKKGRPTKLTPEAQAAIVHQLELGNYVETAAIVSGVSKVSLYDWLKRGEKQESGVFREFLNAVLKAQAFAETRDLDVIDRAAQGVEEVVIKETFEKNKEGNLVLVDKKIEKKVNFDWKASAWRLERRSPKKFGRRSNVEISTSKLDKEQVDAIAKLTE